MFTLIYILFVFVDENLPRFQRLKKAFADKMTVVYLLCYSHVLQYLVRLNHFLQHDEPIIGAVHEQVHNVYPQYSWFLIIGLM